MNDGLSPSGKMASEKVVVSAPMSFAGSAQRIWKLTDKEAVAVKVVMTILALTLIPLAWSFVLSWYLCFGLLLFPYRVIRRGNRKDKVRALQHKEQLEAMSKIQHQQTLQTANLIEQTKATEQSQEDN